MGLRHLSQIVKEQLKVDCAEYPGSGAAGGAAYGLKAFLGADYISGIDFILKISKVDGMMETQNFDYIITGEGKFDEQTLNGKLIKGVTDFGKTQGIPVIAVCGKLDLDEKNLEKIGLEAIVEVREADKSLKYNMEHAPELVEKAIKAFFSK
nr:glycerate kinase [Maribacter sp. Hal144]